MTRHLWVGTASLALLVLTAAPLLAQGPASPDARLINRQLENLEGRLPKMVFEELTAYASRWESLDWDKRQFLETCLVIFQSMLPHQIREAFREAEQTKGDEKRAKVKAVLKSLAEGGEIPAAQVDPSVVVVIVGGDVDAKTGFSDPKRMNIANIWGKIRPYGTFVPVTKTMWVRDRTQWIGEFLTGISVNAVIPDGNVYKFKVPTVCDLFRKISGADARDCWFICRGDTNNVIYDYLEFQREFEDNFKPTAITGAKLRGLDGYVQDHILSQRKEGKTAFEIQRNLPVTLTPGKLHLDVDFNNKEVREFLKDVVAEHGGQLTDSDAFVLRLGVRLLRDPTMAPRLAIFRFGGIPGISQIKSIGTKKELMAKKMKDDDEACLNLWRAFRSNPYYKRFGSFIVLNEYSGAVVVGPKVKIGQASKSYYLNQFVATIAKLLGYDIGQFIQPSRGNPKNKPIKELFEEE